MKQLSEIVDTRGALIAAGRKLFARKGFDGASVRAITTEARANLGAITYHFGSKKALYAAVLESGLGPIRRRVSAAAQAAGSARDRMLKVVEAYFEHLEENPDLPHLLLQEIAAGKPPPDVVVEILQEVMQLIAGLQAQGVADRSIRPGEPILTALSVVSQPIYLHLVAPLLKNVRGVDLFDPDTRRMALDHTLAFVSAGLEPRAEGNT